MSMLPFDLDRDRTWDMSPWLGHGGHRRHHILPAESTFSDLDRQMEHMERQMNRAFRRLGLPRAGMPASDCGLFSPYIERETMGEETEPGKYSMNVHLGNHIEPKDVKVSLKNGMMTVEAKKEYQSDDGCSRVYQEYMRKFTLPQNVNMDEVKSVLTPEGDLHIEAPLPQPALTEQRQPQEIPIKKA